MQQLTYVAKIKNLTQVKGDLDAMGLACSKLWNTALHQTRKAWEEQGKIPNAYATQKMVQEHFWFKRLPAHTGQAIVQEVWQAYKSWFGQRRKGEGERVHPPGFRKRNGKVPRSTIIFKKSGFKLEGDTLRLSRGRTVAEKTGRRYLYLNLALPPEADISDPKLARLVPRGGEWEAHLVCNVPCVEEAPGMGVMAIDLGIVNLAALAAITGRGLAVTMLFSGGALLENDYYFLKQIAKCKPCGWQPGKNKKGASKRERGLHRKRSRRRNHILHTVTRAMIQFCLEHGIGTIVMGDLKHMRQRASGEARNYGKRGNLKLHAWPFATFAQMLAYKANLAGITLIDLSERNTSRTCSVCGCLDSGGRVHRGLYVCGECGATVNADINGAVNLLGKYLQRLESLDAVAFGTGKSTGVSAGVGDIPRLSNYRGWPTIWPQPSVIRYDWGKPNPLVRVAGSAPA